MKHSYQVTNNIVDGKNVFNQPVKNNLTTYDSIKKLQQVKEMITKLVVCWTIIISETIIK